MYVYLKSEKSLWTVGFYSPDGAWHSESDWPTRAEAASRVVELNGGTKRSTVGIRLLGMVRAIDTGRLAEIIKTYEENIGIITPMIAEELKDIATAYPEPWFTEAVKRACLQGKRRLVYIKAILENWRRDGLDKPKKKSDTSGITVIEG